MIDIDKEKKRKEKMEVLKIDEDLLNRQGAFTPSFFDKIEDDFKNNDDGSIGFSVFNTPSKPDEILNTSTQTEVKPHIPTQTEVNIDFITPEQQDKDKSIPPTPQPIPVTIVHEAKDVQRKIVFDTPEKKEKKKRKKPITENEVVKKQKTIGVNPYKQMIEVIMSGFDDQQFSIESSVDHFKFAAGRITKTEHSNATTSELLKHFSEESNCSMKLKYTICDLLIALSDEIRFTSICLCLIRTLIDSLPTTSKERRTESNYTMNVIHFLSTIPKELFIK
jgi:predicted ester cyclase